MISELENTIDLTFIEDDIAEVLKGNDEIHSIMVESEENSISLDENTKLISSRLKGKFLNEAIASYKNKCCQYIK